LQNTHLCTAEGSALNRKVIEQCLPGRKAQGHSSRREQKEKFWPVPKFGQIHIESIGQSIKCTRESVHQAVGLWVGYWPIIPGR
jgi:hypothetical protein